MWCPAPRMHVQANGEAGDVKHKCPVQNLSGNGQDWKGAWKDDEEKQTIMIPRRRLTTTTTNDDTLVDSSSETAAQSAQHTAAAKPGI